MGCGCGRSRKKSKTIRHSKDAQKRAKRREKLRELNKLKDKNIE